MIYELRKQIEYFLRNKIYMVSLIIAAVAGYGYEITHSSLGIDDVCIGLYFDDGLGVSIGRWPFYVINKLFHVTGFEPFIMEFAAVMHLITACSGSQTVKDQVTDTTAKQMIIPYFS